MITIMQRYSLSTMFHTLLQPINAEREAQTLPVGAVGLSPERTLANLNLPCRGVGLSATTRRTNRKAALSGRATCRRNAGL